jgi:hypothetical protein
MSIKVLFTDRFQRDIRRLSKRYHSIRIDLHSLLEQLETGELPGDQISDINYYSKTSDQILLLTIYSKSDQSSINASEVREIITDAEALLVDSENTEEDSGEEQL